MSLKLEQKLTNILLEPHEIKIAMFQKRLKDKKNDERSVLYEIEELVFKYNEQCLTKAERIKFTREDN